MSMGKHGSISPPKKINQKLLLLHRFLSLSDPLLAVAAVAYLLGFVAAVNAALEKLFY